MSNRQWQSRWLLAIVLILAAGGRICAGAAGWHARVLRAVLGVYLVLVGPGWPLRRRCCPRKQLGSAEHVLAAVRDKHRAGRAGRDCPERNAMGAAADLLAGAAGRRDGGGNAGGLAAAAREKDARQAAGRIAERNAGAPQVPTARLALPLVAIVLLGLAVYVARMPAPADRFQGYTTLWVAPNGRAGSARRTHRRAERGVCSPPAIGSKYA